MFRYLNTWKEPMDAIFNLLIPSLILSFYFSNINLKNVDNLTVIIFMISTIYSVFFRIVFEIISRSKYEENKFFISHLYRYFYKHRGYLIFTLSNSKINLVKIFSTIFIMFYGALCVNLVFIYFFQIFTSRFEVNNLIEILIYINLLIYVWDAIIHVYISHLLTSRSIRVKEILIDQDLK